MAFWQSIFRKSALIMTFYEFISCGISVLNIGKSALNMRMYMAFWQLILGNQH